MELVSMTRRELTDALNKKKDVLKKDLFMITSLRPTANNSVQVEVVQNRLLGSRKRTALGALNKSDDRFGNATTMLYDWMIVRPEDFVNFFQDVNITIEDVQAIAAEWKEGQPTGSDAKVFAVLENVTQVNVDGEKLTPVIIVTEVTESQLLNGEFFKGKNADQKAQDVIDNSNRAMKTGSGEDDEFLVHPETGDKIYRFVETLYAEDKPQDSLISGKMLESQYKKLQANTRNITGTELKRDLANSLKSQTEEI